MKGPYEEGLGLINEVVEKLKTDGISWAGKEGSWAHFSIKLHQGRWITQMNGRYTGDFDNRADVYRFMAGVCLKLSILPEEERKGGE